MKKKSAHDPAKTILCPVDFSESSLFTLKRIVQEHSREAELVLLYVHDSAHAKLTEPELVPEHLFARYLVILQAYECRYRLAIEFGRPEDAIIAFARNNRPDFIAIGSHGTSGLSCLIMGSTAEAVVRHAPCPVLLYKCFRREKGADPENRYAGTADQGTPSTMYWF